MKISFQQLLQPMHEAIVVNGEYFLLDKGYDNVVREDDNVILTFQRDGIVHLELKANEGKEPRLAYVACNDFLNTFFPKALRLTQQNDKNSTTFFGFIECVCRVKRGDTAYNRTVNIENAYTTYKDGSPDEHSGINFFITEEPIKVENKGKKKKKHK